MGGGGGEEIRGRHLIARGRLWASHNLGGLQLIPADVMAKGLGLNLFRRIMEAQEGDLNRGFYHEIFEKFQYPSVSKMMGSMGPQLWREAGNRFGGESFFLKIVCKAMADLLALNEQSGEGWQIAAVAGHTLASGIWRFSKVDWEILAENRITMVQDLFGRDEFTGKVKTTLNRSYENLEGVSEFLINKCKQLRQQVHAGQRDVYRAIGGVWEAVQGKKISSFMRTLFRSKVDGEYSAPPSYLSRQREGYALPRIVEYMHGYERIMRADVPNNCRELGFLILNRQLWTSLKQSETDRNRGEISSEKCQLCDEPENTFHLLVDCEAYARRIWIRLEEALNAVAQIKDRGREMRLRLGSFQILYGCKVEGIAGSWDKVFQRSILHTLQWIYNKRTMRLTGRTNANLTITDSRILGHLILIQDKIISLLRFQNKQIDLRGQEAVLEMNSDVCTQSDAD